MCLKAISQLYYPNFEVVVVCDQSSRAAVPQNVSGIKTIAFDDANISRARNLGVAQAAGDIVAFIDDDAVPEPTWLDYLVAPIAAGRAEISGGFVRGRNGISFQWKARKIFFDGSYEDLDVEEETVFPSFAGGAIKTEGTNMAIRRESLVKLGGFNEAYRFYLDETDVNLRASQFGFRTAVCPLAQVHHGYVESERRRKDRAPHSLFEVGASVAIFAREHAMSSADQTVARVREEQRRRLVGFMVSGHLEPHQVDNLLHTFDQGVIKGRVRPSEFPKQGERPKFVPFLRSGKDHISLSGHWIGLFRIVRKARTLVNEGHRVSVFLFTFGTRFHTVRFAASGYWLQHGGILGKSNRTDRYIRFSSLKDRAHQELQRVSEVRLTRSKR